jgi:F-type H+-transporting ATPase subunit gamma
MRDDYFLEPGADALFAELLPKLVSLQVFRALLENAVGEHSARMTAMDSATKNTKDLIGSLTLTMNRARQAAITRELIEIVSGAEALKG